MTEVKIIGRNPLPIYGDRLPPYRAATIFVDVEPELAAEHPRVRGIYCVFESRYYTVTIQVNGGKEVDPKANLDNH